MNRILAIALMSEFAVCTDARPDSVASTKVRQRDHVQRRRHARAGQQLQRWRDHPCQPGTVGPGW